MKAPAFWYSETHPLTRLLEPFGLLYGAVGAWRQRHATPWVAPVPVICVGNVTAGGTGKTPIVLDLLARLPGAHALLRGYGGSEPGPLRVDPRLHDHERVGDEALLLAAAAPTWVSRDRAAGAKAAVAAGARVLVLDDGFQNPGLAKSFSLLVIDGWTGLGNRRLIPAGPLRESLKAALARLRPPLGKGAVVIMGPDRTNLAKRLPRDIPILRAELCPGGEVDQWAGRPVVAFAGIGRPEKFFQTLEALGARLLAVHPFADHYPYAPADIQPILDEAFALGASPVTTAKDAVRLPPDQRQQVDVFPVSVAWEDPAALTALLPEIP